MSAVGKPGSLELICGRCPAPRGMVNVFTWRRVSKWFEGTAVFRSDGCAHELQLTEEWVAQVIPHRSD